MRTRSIYLLPAVALAACNAPMEESVESVQSAASALVTPNLISDPSFDTGVSGFFAQSSGTDSVARSTSNPISPAASLVVSIKGWGNNVWWDYTPSAANAKATNFAVSGKLRG